MLTIGNDRIERRFAARAGSSLVTTALVNKRTKRDYLRTPGHEFTFSVDGRVLASTHFCVESVELRTDRDPVAVSVRLGGNGLAVDVHLEVYASHAVVRKWLTITNRDAAPHVLADLDWEDLELLVDTPATAEVWVDHFTRREKSALVNMDACVLLIHDPTHAEGFVVANEAPGPLKRLAAYSSPGRIAIGYNRDDESVFERVLAPGESFRTPASFLLAFADAIPQDVIDGEYARFVAERLTVCDVARVPSVTVNSWRPHGFAIDRELLLEQIDLAADLGADAYQVDAGWYDRMGDWNADARKFPNGLEEIAERCRARDMRFGLWIAPATVEEGSRPLREHPEWLARSGDGTPNRHPVPGGLTMCLDGPYYEVVVARISDVISRYGVELLKLDLSAVRNVYEPRRYSGCHANGHGHRTPRESHARIMARLVDLARALKAAHPGCLVDVSYELYGVVDGTDLGLTQVADQNWFTNLSSPSELNLRREIYQRGRVTRPWTLNFGGTDLDHPNAPRYGLFSTLTAHGVFWGDLRKLDAPTRAHYQKWFAWVKTQRAYSDFYRYYQVSDIFPVPDGASNRDYRHVIPAARYGHDPRGIHAPGFDPTSPHPGLFWDGVARLDARGEGPIFLFRPAGSPEERFRLRIPWVEALARYRIEDATEERALGTFAGAELRERGIEVRIADPQQAKVLVLRRP